MRNATFLFRTAVAGMFAMALLLMASTAFAGGKLTSVLDDLEWGMSSKEVTKKLEAQIWAEFEAESGSITDIGKKDSLRKKFNSRVESLKESYKELDGNRSGLEVSVVTDEFVPGNGESVLVVREDISTRYYFFVGDQLYKCAIAYNPSYIGDLAFESFIAAVSKKYGKPASETTDEDGFFAQAVWEDGAGNRLRVDDKWQTYDTYLMAFTDTSLESTVSAKHQQHIAARYSEPDVDSSIDALTEGSDEKAGSAADSILGGSTKVDLMAGLPQEDIDAMNDEKLEGKTDDKGGVSEKKRKKRKKKDTRKKKDFKDLEKKDDQKGLIIY